MDALGINWALLIAQIINFVAMVVILQRLLYKPVLNMLQKRTERIEESIKEADQVKEQLASAKKDYDEEMSRARQEAAQVVAQAQERARAQESEILAQARQEADRIRADAREQVERERDQMMGEVKNQIAELVTLTASRVLQAEVSNKHDQLIAESLESLGRQN